MAPAWPQGCEASPQGLCCLNFRLDTMMKSSSHHYHDIMLISYIYNYNMSYNDVMVLSYEFLAIADVCLFISWQRCFLRSGPPPTLFAL